MRFILPPVKKKLPAQVALKRGGIILFIFLFTWIQLMAQDSLSSPNTTDTLTNKNFTYADIAVQKQPGASRIQLLSAARPGWWGHQPGRAAVIGVHTDHSNQTAISILDTPKQLTPQQVKKRVKGVTIANVAGYSAILVGLNAAWYANYPRSGFHFFDDNKEWLQVDKVGHLYSSYIESRASMELWRWTGISHTKRIWLGGLSGAVYQTAIEILDGFSTQWGFSWGDFSANILGSGALIAQELAWDDQRIKLKFSFHKNGYGAADLNKRANELFGSSFAERAIKDYNAQTYWASANLKSFFPSSDLPAWLSVAIGYGADGMFGANENVGKDKEGNISFSRKDVKRYRQWYLAPDIDLTKIKTRKKGIRFLLTVLSAFKFPTPGLELSNGKFKVHALHF
jgi:uncharacterized protein YfiM (DUF2279 family)